VAVGLKHYATSVINLLIVVDLAIIVNVLTLTKTTKKIRVNTMFRSLGNIAKGILAPVEVALKPVEFVAKVVEEVSKPIIELSDEVIDSIDESFKG